MNSTSTTLEPILDILARTLTTAETTFNKLPGSAVIQRYVKSSHQNDPGRSILELILFIFAIRTLLQSRTRADKNFIQFSDKVGFYGPLEIPWLTRALIGSRRARG
jgi:serine palmitoyltransferase